MVRALKAATAVAILTTAIPCHAVRADDFFAGKTITMSTHSEPGGGYEVYLRLLSQHMGKHIPGRPAFAVVSQPGSGGLRAVNYAAKDAPQDGTFLTIVSQSVPVVEATGGPGLQDLARRVQVDRQLHARQQRDRDLGRIEREDAAGRRWRARW